MKKAVDGDGGMKELNNIRTKAAQARAAAVSWLGHARAACEKHPALALVAVLCAPELFLLIMGMACKAVPQFLAASVAILAVCVAMWAVGLVFWVYAVACRRKGKHACVPRAKAQERSAR